jgi:MinD-like ATPase involved in chromosome partitioning or flagellar assembly
VTDVGIAVPIDDARRLVTEAARHGHRVVAECSGADELAGRLARTRPELVIAGATPQYLNARLVGECDAHGVRLLVVAESPAERRHAQALGVLDLVPPPVTWEALGPRPPEPDRSGPSGAAPGRVIAVWGPEGAPGRTSLAIALAAELAAAGRTVALADIDSHAAAVAPALGLLDEAPGFAAACRLAGTGGLAVGEFDRVAVPVRTGASLLNVLTGIGRPSRWPELTAERVARVLELARDWVEVVVADVAASLEQDEEIVGDPGGPRRNAATTTTLREADLVVAVAPADPIGLARFLRGHADLLEHVPPDRVLVVVNKLRASAIGLDPGSQVRQTLARFGGIDDPAYVPWDPGAFDAALLSGRPLPDAAPRSPARAALRRVATERLGVTGVSATRVDRWRRARR